MKPPFKLNGVVKATNFAIQAARAEKMFKAIHAEAEKLGFKFLHDEMIVPPVAEQTPEQAAFLERIFKKRGE